MQTPTFATFLDKGGTGKTTSTAHLGVALSQLGQNVLLIDLAGKQGDLTKHFGLKSEVVAAMEADEDWPNIATTFQKDEYKQIVNKLGPKMAVDGLIMETDEGPDLIPYHESLDGLDDELGIIDDASDRYSRLTWFLESYVDDREYDTILIDLPGGTDNVVYNGLWAAGDVIAPVEMGRFEWEQVETLESDLHSIDEKFDDSPDMTITMIIPNKVDSRTNLFTKYMDKYEDEYGPLVAPKAVPKSQDLKNANDDGKTAFALANPSSTADRATDAYRANARALLDRHNIVYEVPA